MAVLLRWITVAFLGGAGIGGTALFFYTGTGTEVERVIGDEGSVSICSFNVQFIGISPTREEGPLAEVVDDCDIVVVQELVSPPRPGTFPNGDPFNPDQDSNEYFTAMEAEGFDWVLSEEDTGTNNDLVHNNGFATEWFVAFYKPERVQLANDLPSGFLAADRYDHPDYERVPYAFAFRSLDGNLDFVLISVHLNPGSGPSNRARRAQEMGAISAWIDANDDGGESDFIILGDMNLQNRQELIDITPAGLVSINNQFLPTNTGRTEAYDHVMLNLYLTSEIDLQFGFLALDLREAFAPIWGSLGIAGPYPGEPYQHNGFRALFSDHNPVVFKLTIPTTDDD